MFDQRREFPPRILGRCLWDGRKRLLTLLDLDLASGEVKAKEMAKEMGLLMHASVDRSLERRRRGGWTAVLSLPVPMLVP